MRDLSKKIHPGAEQLMMTTMSRYAAEDEGKCQSQE
jgi:hypothetical protein